MTPSGLLPKLTAALPVPAALAAAVVRGHNACSNTNPPRNWLSAHWPATVLFALFSGVFGFFIFGHVFWRDEALPALIALHNPGFADFLRAMRYEGTPGLWHAILWCLAKFLPLTPLTVAAAFFVFFEAFLFVTFFLLRIPLVWRVVIILQEPSLWNATNVRQYLLAALCIVFFAAVYQRNWRHRSLVLAATLAALIQTCVHGLIIAGALFVFWAFENARSRGKRYEHAYLFLPASLLLALAQLVSPADQIIGLSGWDTAFSLQRFVEIGVGLPLVVLLKKPVLLVCFLVVIAAIGLSAARRDRVRVLAALTVSAVVLAAFYAIAYAKISGQRHYYLLTYMIIALLVILYHPCQTAEAWGKWGKICGALFSVFVLAVSTQHFSSLAGKLFSVKKSGSREAAAYLDAHFPTKTVLSKSEIFEAPVRFYRRTDAPVFALGRQAFVKWTVWNHASVDFVRTPSVESVRVSELRKDLLDLHRTHPATFEAEPVVVLSGQRFIPDEPLLPGGDIPVDDRYRLTFVSAFGNAAEENYVIFLLQRLGGPESAGAERRWSGGSRAADAAPSAAPGREPESDTQTARGISAAAAR